MLFAIGGAVDAQGEKQVLKRLLAEARGAESSVCVVTTATAYPEEARQMYENAFSSLGVRRITTMHLSNPGEADAQAAADSVRDADIVFFSGGDQLRLANTLNGTLFMKALNERFQKSGIIAGTSAGAAVLSKQMIYGETISDDGGSKDVVSLKNGFGFVSNFIIDTHFSERGRLSRLFAMVAASGGQMGLGLDENTAAIIKPDGTLEVIGPGSVTLVKGDKAEKLKSGDKRSFISADACP